MKAKDQGILLRKIPYSENSLIVTFFCRNNGLKSFMFQGGKKKKGNLLFPLSIIEFEYYSRSDSSLGKITDIAPDFIAQSSITHPIKSTLLFFFAEILQQTIRQEEKEEAFFLFLAAEIHEFDLAPFEANYAIWFLLELTKWLGIEPEAQSPNASHLDGTNGRIFDIPETTEKLIATGAHVSFLSQMLFLSKDKSLSIPSNGKIRKQAMTTLLTYYKIHMDGFTFPKSLEVLDEVWNN